MRIPAVVADVLLLFLACMSAILFAVGFLNVVFAASPADYAAGSVSMALAVAGIVIPARTRRRTG